VKSFFSNHLDTFRGRAGKIEVGLLSERMTVFQKLSLALCMPLSLALGDQSSTTQTFNDAPLGAAPPGFSFAAMRQGEPGKWVVQKHDADVVLWHEKGRSTLGYSLAISPVRTNSNISLTARLRFVDGAKVGGLVWHYLNDQHHYSLILDLNSNEVSLYRVAKGNRVRLEIEKGLDLDAKAWLELKVVHVDDTVDAFVRGVRVFQDQDHQNRWTEGSSGAGFIAAANAGVEFDDLNIMTKGTHR
jgi:hypothetical protein